MNPITFLKKEIREAEKMERGEKEFHYFWLAFVVLASIFAVVFFIFLVTTLTIKAPGLLLASIVVPTVPILTVMSLLKLWGRKLKR